MVLLIAGLATMTFLLLMDSWIFASTAQWLRCPYNEFTRGLFAAGSIVLSAIGLLSHSEDVSIPAILISDGLITLAISLLILQKALAVAAWRAFALVGACLFLEFLQVGVSEAIIRPFVVEAFAIPNRSMSPTFYPGDCVVANKLEHPRRWDLVLYYAIRPDGKVGNLVYCKRLVGLPGERLRFEAGKVFVNDQEKSCPSVVAGKYRTCQQFGRYHEGETITLRSDEIFLMDDSVDKSMDSRFAGPSKIATVVGVADFLYWPVSRFRLLR
jgi:signal peptidase I